MYLRVALSLALLASLHTHALPTNNKDKVSLRSDEGMMPDHLGESLGPHEDSLPAASSLSDVELVAEDEDEEEEEEGLGDNRREGQHFFPSFAPLFSSPPLGHSRPHNYEVDSPHHRGSFSDPPFRYRSIYQNEDSERMLGSGNFGVIKGGTYYGAANDESDEYEPPYYRGNNGHGRPPYFRGNPQPAYRHGGDFFAGFRDFADITTPAKPAYSQYFVVYANRNSSEHAPSSRPKNIIEQLALLDKADKMSKNKKKLTQYKEKTKQVEYKKKYKSPKESYEPLLALS